MTAFRSALFFVLLQGWTLTLGTLYLPLLLTSERLVRAAATFWVRGVFVLLRVTCGLGWEVRGTVPQGAALVASKHQSTLETFVFFLVLGNPAVILKQELLKIPFFGWYLRKTGAIAIDRAAGTKALKDMVKGAAAAAALGRPVLIFPEGHRMDIGAAPDYHTGVAMLYGALGQPCVPVALNTGCFWGRGSLAKLTGTAVIEFLEPIPPGMDRKAFMVELQACIEGATARLVAEATAISA